MSQQYSLRWNNHQPNFISMFTNLLNTQTLVDVTLAAEGKHLLAHKVVLSACSSYFQALFVDNPSRHPIVILKDVTFANLRTMVDFMYYGEVNVTEEQLPQVLDTAKHLKIKGLTEMPDSTSLTRSQGNDLPNAQEAPETSPPNSPTPKRRRRRKSSTGSTCLNMIGEDRSDIGNQTGDLPRSDTITLSSVPRRRDFHDDRTIDQAQQTNEHHNLNMEPLSMDANSHITPGSAHRRLKFFKRQSRLTEAQDLKRESSEPGASTAQPPLRKHESYPPYSKKRESSEPAASTAQPPLLKHDSYPPYAKNRQIKNEQKVGALLIRTYTIPDKSTTPMGESGEGSTQRASHTPAVRSGPPLSCNFCWNTVDDCGRILRRKTQFHCPECRTNLCIVPCFHEYHEGTSSNAVKPEHVTCKPNISDEST